MTADQANAAPLHALSDTPRALFYAVPLTLLRVWLGWQWLNAGLQKVFDADWMTGSGAGLLSFWSFALAPRPNGGSAITYDWYRAFIQLLIDSNAQTWFAQLIALGELGVGLGLLVGAFVPIAAVGGLTMNMAYMLAGVTSVNPVLALAAGIVWVGRQHSGVVGLDGLLRYHRVLSGKLLRRSSALAASAA